MVPGTSTAAQKSPQYRMLAAAMRWTFRLGLLLLVLLAAYTVWPYADLYRLARAIERRDAAAVSRDVEFRSLRASINRQVLNAYLRLTGKEARLGPFGDLAVGAAASAIDPLAADMASAERLIGFFDQGWPREVMPNAPSGRIELLPAGSLGKLWDLYANSEYSFGEFFVVVPSAVPASQRFRLQLRLIQWRWKLVDVQLPEELRARLAQELIKATEKKQ